MTIGQNAFLAQFAAQDFVTPEQAADRLNQMMAIIQDRLDQLEGTRGDSTIQYPLRIEDTDGRLIHGFSGDSDV